LHEKGFNRQDAKNAKASLGRCHHELFKSGLVLFVADLFHPVNRFTVELLLNGNVRQDNMGFSAPHFAAQPFSAFSRS
jgi:hypothetical protein